MPSSECAVATCGNYHSKTKGKGISYHRFPKNEKLVKAWTLACKRGDRFNPQASTICSNHFKEEDFQRDLQNEMLNLPLRRILVKDAVPSLNLPGTGRVKAEAKGLSQRDIRQDKRNNKSLVDYLLDSTLETETVVKVEEDSSMEQCVENQVDLFATIKCLENENDSIKKQNRILQNRIQYLENANRKVKSLKQEIYSLNAEMRKFKQSVKQKSFEDEQNVKRILSKVFTPGQIKVLFGSQRVVWNSEDMAAAIALRAVSRRAYYYLKETIKIPLPGLSTIRRWTTNINIKTEI